MNSVLRKVARGLKYRPLPGLIGKRVTIQSANSVPANIGAMLDRSFPLPVRFSGPQEPWLTGALAKYRILDLTFALDALEWKPGDTAGISLLKEFGFIIQRNEVSEDVWESMSQDDDPTCIMSLDEDIGRSQALLRLFVEEVPRRGLFDYLKETMKVGKGHLFEGGVAEMEQLLDGFFPHEMAVTDACLTNADSIWFHKHFYL